MNEERAWTERVNGFPVEYVNWGKDFDCWNYYVYFTAKNTPSAFWEKLLAIPAEEHSISDFDSWLSEIEWHGGITYASFERDGLQNIVAVKAGCDYAHLWDEGVEYDLTALQQDSRVTIMSAQALFAL